MTQTKGDTTFPNKQGGKEKLPENHQTGQKTNRCTLKVKCVRFGDFEDETSPSSGYIIDCSPYSIMSL